MATAQNPDELPTVTGKKRTVKVRATLTEFGRDWRLIRPNSIVASQLMDAGDNINPVYISKYFAAHVHPDDRASEQERYLGELAAKLNISADNLRAAMAQTAQKLNVQVALSDSQHAHQMLTPPTEPAGRAKKGEAFEA